MPLAIALDRPQKRRVHHSTGPWAAMPEEVDRSYIRIRGAVPGSRFKIANVLTPNFEGVDPREAQETRANARLIAAAPELLKALDALLSAIPVEVAIQAKGLEEPFAAAHELIEKVIGDAA